MSIMNGARFVQMVCYLQATESLMDQYYAEKRPRVVSESTRQGR